MPRRTANPAPRTANPAQRTAGPAHRAAKLWRRAAKIMRHTARLARRVMRHTARLARRVRRWWRPAPRPAKIIMGVLVTFVVWLLCNWIYQVVRKPSELFFPVSGTLNKSPAETWQQYASIFRKYSTGVMTPDLLAAIAQINFDCWMKPRTKGPISASAQPPGYAPSRISAPPALLHRVPPVNSSPR